MPYCDKKTISFLVTTKCNLACTYCYGSRNQEKKTLDFAFAKRVILDYLSDYDISMIRFFADGEPTLEIELIKNIYSFAKNIRPDLKAEIQTNGFFNEDTAEWLGKNLDNVWISMDLLPEENDIYRMTADKKPSSPFIENSLAYFRDMKDRKAEIGIRATITKYNIDHQIEGMDYFFDKYGVKVFWVDPIFPPVDNDGKSYDEIDMMQFAHNFIAAHTHANSRGIFYESNLTTNFDGKTQMACRACIPMPHLTVDGYLSACEMATIGAKPGNMAPFIYAHYDKESDKIIYNLDNLKIIRTRVLSNMPECVDCVAKEHCAGFCLGETQNENGNFFETKTRVCKALRYIFMEIGGEYERFNGCFPYFHP